MYSSPNVIRMMKSRRMRWAGHVARIGEKRDAYRILVGKTEGERPLGRPRHRWVDNKKNFKFAWGGRGRIKVHSTLWPLNGQIVSAPGDYDNGELGGMIGRGNRSTRSIPAPVPLCPPQTPHAART
jgi:hypothetical protein